MITIISGTNRKNSVSSEVAKAYAELLNKQGILNQILDLQDLPNDFMFSALYGQVNEDFQKLVKRFIYDSSALVIISPEYNGSYPGVLKSFIDGWDRRLLNNQKVGLVGVASGRQGNSRGMDHLSAVLNYIGLTIVPSLIPISLIDGLLNEDKKLTDKSTLDVLAKQIEML
ncbi:MAG: chromate reductase [Glaciecola sp.]|jgi:chromate reductase